MEKRGALVIAGIFDGRGGLERQTNALAVALAERTEVTLVTWTVSPRPRVEHRDDGVTVVRVPTLASRLEEHPKFLAWANGAASVATGVLAALARHRSYSSILAIGLLPEGVVAAIAGRILRRPCVLYAWIAAPSGGSVPLLERSTLAALWKRTLSGAKAYVTQTKDVAADLARSGFRSDRVHVIPVGVDLEAFAPADSNTRRNAKSRLGVGSARVALYHGRFDLRQKRLDLLLSAWTSADPEGWRLVLAGDGPDKGKVRKLAEQLDASVVFVGWQEDARWLLNAADLAVLPTELEGTSGALAEALACAVPVLASRVPAHDRIRPDGVVMVPNEHDAWVSALVDLTQNADHREALARMARPWVEKNFDARKRVEAFAALLEV
jgi:glycosyltransferase involved in cell wall biosynthesis